jgi:hypothetical protein
MQYNCYSCLNVLKSSVSLQKIVGGGPLRPFLRGLGAGATTTTAASWPPLPSPLPPPPYPLLLPPPPLLHWLGLVIAIWLDIIVVNDYKIGESFG